MGGDEGRTTVVSQRTPRLPTFSCIAGGIVVSPGQEPAPADVFISKGRIAAIKPSSRAVPPAGRAFLAKGAFVAPGFIDVHVHGGGGADVMDGTLSAIRTVATQHAKGGTTGLLATTTTGSPEGLVRALQAVQALTGKPLPGATVLGAHVEGPYISPIQRGAQDPAFIRRPRPEEHLELLARFPCIRWFTAAPELPGAARLGRELKRRGIVAAMGHSDATFPQAQKALNYGYCHVTHLYSTMAGVRRINLRRVGGLVEAALLLDELTVEVIGDGLHLPGHLLELVVRNKGTDKVLLVTDAMRATGMPWGEYRLGGKAGLAVIVKGGMATLADGSALAGSVATMNLCVTTMVEEAKVSLPDAVAMASTNPARLLGMDGRKGHLRPGYDADIVAFDKHFNVLLTIAGGRTVHLAKEIRR